MLRRVAEGVNDFFSNVYGKTDTWANQFNAIVHAKVDAQGGSSSNGTTSLYGTSTKSKICIEVLSNSKDSSSDISDDILKDSQTKPDDADFIREVESHFEATTINSPNGGVGQFSPTRLQKKLNSQQSSETIDDKPARRSSLNVNSVSND